MAENELPLERQDPAKNAKKAKKVEKPKAKKEKNTAHAPLLVEFTVTLSVVILVIVFFTIVSVSLVTGTSLIDFVVRTSISLLILGGLLFLIAHQVASGMKPSREVKKPVEPVEPKETKELEAPALSEVK
ncbi:MAG: hypothetical protein IPG80_00450 [Anaerolineales bacterium]|uniref:hypothetical protein n=1 Tax=Candidatus Villigracilis vicinus TaxID=3140679 RepID=UPI003136534E|nr:hypothetical protein [Anaerolineales bacterium]